MAFMMTPNYALQYTQWIVPDPDKAELFRRAQAFDHKTAYWPAQLSHRGVVLPGDRFPDRGKNGGMRSFNSRTAMSQMGWGPATRRGNHLDGEIVISPKVMNTIVVPAGPR